MKDPFNHYNVLMMENGNNLSKNSIKVERDKIEHILKIRFKVICILYDKLFKNLINVAEH